MVDETSSLPADDLQRANAYADSVARNDLGRIGVLVVNTTNGMAPRAFAEQVFLRASALNTPRHDGILFFIALGDRKAEILLDSGVKSAADQSRSDAAMQNVIVPSFKRGQPGLAVSEGTRALLELLSESPINSKTANGGGSAVNLNPVDDAPPREKYVKPLAELPISRSRSFLVDDAHALTVGETEQVEETLNRLYADGRARLYVYVVDTGAYQLGVHDLARVLREKLQSGTTPIQVAVLSMNPPSFALDGEPLAAGVKGWASDQLINDVKQKLDGYQLSEATLQFVQGYERLANGGPGMADYSVAASKKAQAGMRVVTESAIVWFPALLLAGVLIIPRWLRNRPRKCKTCGDPRNHLTEQADDAYLNSGQKHEEGLGSVDYDVWWCTRCEDALVLRYRKWFSAYCACPACNFIVAMQKTRTLVYATYSSGGQVEVNLDCTKCGHHQSHIRYTPRLQRSTSSSSSRWSSGSRSSSGGGGGSRFGGSSGSW